MIQFDASTWLTGKPTNGHELIIFSQLLEIFFKVLIIAERYRCISSEIGLVRRIWQINRNGVNNCEFIFSNSFFINPRSVSIIDLASLTDFQCKARKKSQSPGYNWPNSTSWKLRIKTGTSKFIQSVEILLYEQKYCFECEGNLKRSQR